MAGSVPLRAQFTPSFFYAPPYHGFTNFAGLPGQGVGSADGTGSDARFTQPEAVATDPDGNIFVGDTQNQTIRKITPAGVVTTFAGIVYGFGTNDGVGSAARFAYPKGLATDAAGNIYLADERNNTIRKITPDAVVTTLAGLAGQSGSADGTGSAARFNRPSAVAVDGAGNVYVADTYNFMIRKVTPDGAVSTLAGRPTGFGNADGQGTNATFYFPLGIAVNTAGVIYVANTDAHRIRKITPDGYVTTLAGGGAGGKDGVGTNAGIGFPRGLAVDSAGNILVASVSSSTLRRITPEGVVTTVAGADGVSGSTNGIAAAARFSSPQAVAVDAAGNLYVADTQNNRIVKGTPVSETITLRADSLITLNNRPYLRLRLEGPVGVRVAVDSSADLKNWLPTGSYLLTENGLAIDQQATRLRGFFRARMVP